MCSGYRHRLHILKKKISITLRKTLEELDSLFLSWCVTVTLPNTNMSSEMELTDIIYKQQDTIGAL